MAVGAKLDEEELSGARQITFGLCRNEEGPAEDEPKPKPGEPRPQGTFGTLLPTEKLEPGRYFLRVVATDTVGNSIARTTRVAITSAADVPTEKGTIAGRVTVGDQSAENMNVTITGDAHTATAKTGSGGRYVLRDVPPGKYKIFVKGLTRFGMKDNRGKEKEVTVQPGKTVNGDVILQW
jgi:hypothetical protein